MLRQGQKIRWVGPTYREGQDPYVVHPGDIGVYVCPDGETQADGLVVDFPHVGGFCCKLDHVVPVDDVEPTNA
jgi:hypothetical protein